MILENAWTFSLSPSKKRMERNATPLLKYSNPGPGNILIGSFKKISTYAIVFYMKGASI